MAHLHDDKTLLFLVPLMLESYRLNELIGLLIFGSQETSADALLNVDDKLILLQRTIEFEASDFFL